MGASNAVKTGKQETQLLDIDEEIQANGVQFIPEIHSMRVLGSLGRHDR